MCCVLGWCKVSGLDDMGRSVGNRFWYKDTAWKRLGVLRGIGMVVLHARGEIGRCCDNVSSFQV